MGINSVISTSNTRKITVIIKKWREKGIRGEEDGSNPHSNGEDFSRSLKDFFEIIVLIRIILDLRINTIILKREIMKIINTIDRSLDWKSRIIFILY